MTEVTSTSTVETSAKPARQNRNGNSYKSARAFLESHRKADSADIQATLKDKGKFAFVQSTFDAMKGYGIDYKVLFSLPQKQVKRAIQMVNAVTEKNYANIDATTACGLYALHLAPDSGLSFDALHYLIAGQARADGAAGDSKGVSRMRLVKLFSRVGANTISTQKSRSFGDNGFCDALGVTAGAHRTVDRTVTLDRAHPLVVAFVDLIDRATEGQIDSIGGKKED